MFKPHTIIRLRRNGLSVGGDPARPGSELLAVSYVRAYGNVLHDRFVVQARGLGLRVHSSLPAPPLPSLHISRKG